MELPKKHIRGRMRELIKRSCNASDMSVSDESRRFQIALFKFFFDAIDVNIDYKNKILRVKSSKPIKSDPLSLYNLSESVVAEIYYSNLEETLDGCLEKGKLQTRFYELLLLNYNKIGLASSSTDTI